MEKKLKKTADKSKYLIIVIFIAALSASMVYAVSNFSRLNSGGGEIVIDVFGVCKKVTRTAAGDIFIPTKTDAEWSAFRNNATGVKLDNCVADVPCSGTPTVTDVDGNIYNTVQIGSQCWMKENLKVTKNLSGAGIARDCYNDDANNCNIYGGLYKKTTTMNGSTTEGAQGICPNNWHVPTDSEWYALESGLATGLCDPNRSGSPDGAGCDPAGTKLNVSGSSGFNGVLGGMRSSSMSNYTGKDLFGIYWSSTDWDGSNLFRALGSGISTVNRNAYFSDIGLSYSVRCVKN